MPSEPITLRRLHVVERLIYLRGNCPCCGERARRRLVDFGASLDTRSIRSGGRTGPGLIPTGRRSIGSRTGRNGGSARRRSGLFLRTATRASKRGAATCGAITRPCLKSLTCRRRTRPASTTSKSGSGAASAVASTSALPRIPPHARQRRGRTRASPRGAVAGGGRAWRCLISMSGVRRTC